MRTSIRKKKVLRFPPSVPGAGENHRGVIGIWGGFQSVLFRELPCELLHFLREERHLGDAVFAFRLASQIVCGPGGEGFHRRQRPRGLQYK